MLGDNQNYPAQPIAEVFSSENSHTVGSFRFYIDGQRWEWSDEVAAMHGYEPGTITPTTELLLQHKHPDDRDRVAVIVNDLTNGTPFSSRHRIIDTRGDIHRVVVVGDRVFDENGNFIGTEGFYIDVTASHQADLNANLEIAVQEFNASRAIIEQAKGILMLAYGVPADRAFDVLKWRSQNMNIKLRLLAERFVTAVLNDSDIGETARHHIDRLLLTAHEETD